MKATANGAWRRLTNETQETKQADPEVKRQGQREKNVMSEYTEIECDQPGVASAVKAYLDDLLAQDEETLRVDSHVDGSNACITYADVNERERAKLDAQLIGYRDGRSSQ
jgi:hypothetical protein